VSPGLPAVTAKELIRVATRPGFELDRQKGSHAVYRRASDGPRGVIPVHTGKTIKPKTLTGILEDLGLTVEGLRELL
jgi:predicted RNA binding protein YcfA (HicA-like mRNA interferase family)